MNDYEFIAPPRIVFGWGRRRELGPLAQSLGRRAFVVLGSRTLHRNGAWSDLAKQLQQAGVEPIETGILSREPEVGDVDQLVGALRDQRAGTNDLMVAVGGGAAIDLAKAASALVTNRHGSSVRDFLEGVGKGLQITEPPLPLLAMPTTGGTGTEATKNAVISVNDPPVKKSIRSPLMVPKIVLVDPELSVSVPPETTAWTGMDAITQLIESYICRFAKPIPQALALHGLQIALPMVREAVKNGASRPAREAMAHAALLSGMALANSGLGFAHGVAAALGVYAKLPHGLACAMMLPVALRVNREVAEKPLAELARACLPVGMHSDSAATLAFVDHIDALCNDLKVPTKLSQVGVRSDQLDDLVTGSRGNSMNGNPCQLSDAELRKVLEARLVILAAGLTPAWQQIMRFRKLELGEVNRAAEVHWCASGKVLNAGMALAALGAESHTLSPAGGWSGEAMRAEFAQRDIPATWLLTSVSSRICTTILDATRASTELVENATAIPEYDLDRFVDAFERLASSAIFAVLTGSLPSGTPPTFYRTLLERTRCPVVLDVRGPELLAALDCKPRVVKPNREELAMTVGRQLPDRAAVVSAMRELIERGARAVVVTQGKSAVWIADGNQAWEVTPPDVTPIVNPIGCGDCLAAGIAIGLTRGDSLLEAVRFGMAAAADNVTELLPARLAPQRVEAIMQRIAAATRL